MQYMLLIYSGTARENWESLPEEEQKAITSEYFAISEAPGVTGGNQLQPAETATTVRVEEAAQEAFAVAAERWPRDGTPDNPRAWLVTTARNRAIDRIRRERTLAEKTRLLDTPQWTEDEVDDTTIPDERLE